MGVQLECFEHIDDFLQPLGERIELAEYVHFRKLELLLVLPSSRVSPENNGAEGFSAIYIK